MEVKQYITGEEKAGEVVLKYPEAAMALIECGMGCISCPAAEMETINQACEVHGLEPKEVVDYVNERMTDLGVAMKN